MSPKPKRTDTEILREIAEDYLALAAQAEDYAVVDNERWKRYLWLVRLSKRLGKEGNPTQPSKPLP